MKGRLKGMRAYLIGPMDECGDLGKGWRLDIQKFLWGLRCGVLNPCDKAINVGVEDEELHLKLGKLRELINTMKMQDVIILLMTAIQKLKN